MFSFEELSKEFLIRIDFYQHSSSLRYFIDFN